MISKNDAQAVVKDVALDARDLSVRAGGTVVNGVKAAPTAAKGLLSKVASVKDLRIVNKDRVKKARNKK